ncbi:MAG: ABC-F family ATP-binding cassette domain-containing protein [Planctomycetes bacterium]|nr:ABC-F family ATP-binding cassette domain-containing protein [Planctomycetota bacterium]
MPLLAATNIRHSYGNTVILDGCSLSVEAGDRIGIVGRNGTGKTTFLKIMAGAFKPDSGDVATARGCRAGYLSQDPVLDPEETLRGAAEGAFAELHRLHQQLDRVYHDMAEATGEALDKLMKVQMRLEAEMEAAGGYAVEHRIEETLHGLGLEDKFFNVKVRDLSGGQKGRLALSRLLLEQPDVLLLDEPTNHLDIDGVLWLERFLREEFRGAVVMISHDRYLLNHVVSKIVEVENGRLIDYPGNYAAFRETRALRRLTMMRAYENQQDKFRQEEAFIRKYKAGQRAAQAQGRLARLEREKRDSTLERPVELAELELKLPEAERSGDIVALARGVSKAYAEDSEHPKVLFKGLDVTISRGERWGVIGPNGAGKSTLVRCLLGETPADAGTVKLGANLRTAYFRQNQDFPDLSLTVYEYLQKVMKKENPHREVREQEARNLAGAFLFSGDEQTRDLGTLSGGERTRAVLAGLLCSGKNLLILDEPTNHLDISSAERLEDMLALPIEETSEQPGREGGPFEHTLILISHDRAFIDACCNRLLVLDGKGNCEVFTGNYSAWHEREEARRKAAADAEAQAKRQRERDEQDRKRRETEQKAAQASKATNTPPGKQGGKQGAGPGGKTAGKQGPSSTSTNALERLKTEQLEEKIQKIESRIRAIDASMSDPDVYRDNRKMSQLGDERSKLVADLEPLEFEWMRRAESN